MCLDGCLAGQGKGQGQKQVLRVAQDDSWVGVRVGEFGLSEFGLARVRAG
jgi:hypothetical protein